MKLLVLLAHLAHQRGFAGASPLPKVQVEFLHRRLSDDYFDDRSVWGIVWSCVATLIACTWVAVHPNIPAADDSEWRIFGRRLAIMGYLLFAPEVVIMWAARQHFAAKDIAKQYQDHTGWTRTHGFFLIMGGFVLHDSDGQFLRTLTINDFEDLQLKQKIEWPTITEKEIKDRSKADVFSKSLVVLQTTWFIVQCISRMALRLTITELEVITLAFAVLNGLTYWLWWHKPSDVRCTVPIYLKPGNLGPVVHRRSTSTSGPSRRWYRDRISSPVRPFHSPPSISTGTTSTGSFVLPPVSPFQAPIHHFHLPPSTSRRTSSTSSSSPSASPFPAPIHPFLVPPSIPTRTASTHSFVSAPASPFPVPFEPPSPTSTRTASTRHSASPSTPSSYDETVTYLHYPKSSSDILQSHLSSTQSNTGSSILSSQSPAQRPDDDDDDAVTVMHYPRTSRRTRRRSTRSLIQVPPLQPNEKERQKSTFMSVLMAFWNALRAIFTPVVSMVNQDRLPHDYRGRVPTFYSPHPKKTVIDPAILTVIGVIIIFGLVHFIPWFATFPTYKQKLLWRMSAVLILTLPIFITEWLQMLVVIVPIVLPLYAFARLTLIILPIMLLRNLPHSALIELKWSEFFPHI